MHQEPLDDNRNSIKNEKLNPKDNQISEENKCFAPETAASESSSPNTSKDEQGKI